MPKTNRKFWREKLAGNVDRNARQQIELSTADWRVAVIWECALKSRNIDPLVRRIAKWMKSNCPKLECPPVGRK